mmetsp:Transcript_22139/g.55529  ORF Transcript_22139/g.55529 Transcript_22139/m.55529 type:complete len:208 (+) Transcript_22139:314-937(+)
MHQGVSACSAPCTCSCDLSEERSVCPSMISSAHFRILERKGSRTLQRCDSTGRSSFLRSCADTLNCNRSSVLSSEPCLSQHLSGIRVPGPSHTTSSGLSRSLEGLRTKTTGHFSISALQFLSVVWTSSGKMSEKWMNTGTREERGGWVRVFLSLRLNTNRSEARTLKNLSGAALLPFLPLDGAFLLATAPVLLLTCIAFLVRRRSKL